MYPSPTVLMKKERKCVSTLLKINHVIYFGKILDPTIIDIIITDLLTLQIQIPY